jgi:hypothetical protein
MSEFRPNPFRGIAWRHRGKRLPSPRTALYRYYDRAKRLLYIGISNDALDRWMGHKRQSPWAAKATLMTIQHYPTREAAQFAEARAIILEMPRYNVTRYTGYGWMYVTPSQLARLLKKGRR